MDISAAQFKAECLKLMDQVEKTRQPIIITKHGRPVAQLAPVPADTDSLFGYMKGTVRINADVMAPLDVEWSALSGDEEHLYKGMRRLPKPARKK
ncbi:MAG TPA: type II toxin-antitoxin system prevent-host-death family antitoxin [Steroidobacteraceae bacterium]|nr:type II toxin-antitoxin system prevent-host-death family antitoxin [Steroidobacteraceae bacterium]